MSKIPRSHPRYFSLKTREKISRGMKKGLIHETGLIAHGRGEAFDYLIGEKTTPFADEACKVAAAALILAKNPVISINGNTAVLAGKECIDLANAVPCKIEVNLFHKTKKRTKTIIKELLKLGAKEVYGKKGDARIPGLEHSRGICDSDGIYSADLVLVPLEDGDRCQALINMGKKVIAIDLNPLSRTARSASVTIVDNVIRAIPNIKRWVEILKNEDRNSVENLVKNWDNTKMLKNVCKFISRRLEAI